MRVKAVLVYLVLLAILATITDASLVSASGRRRARSILQPTTQSVLRNKLHLTHSAKGALLASDPALAAFDNALTAFRTAATEMDAAQKKLSEAQAEKPQTYSRVALAQEIFKQASAAFDNARAVLDVAAANRNSRVAGDDKVVKAWKAFTSARAKLYLPGSPPTEAIRASVVTAEDNLKRAQIEARVNRRFPEPPPKPAAPAVNAASAAAAAGAASGKNVKTPLQPVAKQQPPLYGGAAAAAVAKPPVLQREPSITGSGTVRVLTEKEVLAIRDAEIRGKNPFNAMYAGIEEGANQLDARMKASMAKDGVIDPDGWFAGLLRSFPKALYRAGTSVGTIIGGTSDAAHSAAEQSHQGAAPGQVAKQFGKKMIPIAISAGKTGATIASLGATAGADVLFSDILVDMAQDLARDAFVGKAARFLTAVQGGANAAVAAGIPANVQLGKEAIALAATFNDNLHSRVKLALFLAANGGQYLGPDANNALNRIGMPSTPLSAVDKMRVFLRVRYASGTISKEQYDVGEAQLNKPEVQRQAQRLVDQALAAQAAAVDAKKK